MYNGVSVVVLFLLLYLPDLNLLKEYFKELKKIYRKWYRRSSLRN